MADIDATIAHLDRLIRCYRAHTLHMGGMDAIVTSSAALIDEVKRLRDHVRVQDAALALVTVERDALRAELDETICVRGAK